MAANTINSGLATVRGAKEKHLLNPKLGKITLGEGDPKLANTALWIERHQHCRRMT